MSKHVEPGTVISGTLRTEDLVPAFAAELERVAAADDRDAQDLIREADDIDHDDPDVVEYVDALIDALNLYAPEGMYFSAHPGDAADFGWWEAGEDYAENQRRQPPPPPRRKKRERSTPERLRSMVREHEAEERPFDPEAPRESYAKPHHFAVNAEESFWRVTADNPWPMERVELQLGAGNRRAGADHIAWIRKQPHPLAIVESRRHGAWDANLPDQYAAYVSLYAHLQSEGYESNASSLSPAEQDAARAHLRSKRNLEGPGGFRFGQPFTYEGERWLIYDFDAEGRSFTLVLISPDMRRMVRDVSPESHAPNASWREQREIPFRHRGRSYKLVINRGGHWSLHDDAGTQVKSGTIQYGQLGYARGPAPKGTVDAADEALRRSGLWAYSAPSAKWTEGDGHEANTGQRTRERALSALADETEEYDRHAADELRLYIDNERQFSPDSPEGMGRAVARNMLKKIRANKYDSTLAVKGWLHVVDAAAKAYVKEFGSSQPWNKMFDAPTRRAVARDLAHDFYERAQAGEFEHVRNADSDSDGEDDDDEGPIVATSGEIRRVSSWYGLTPGEARVFIEHPQAENIRREHDAWREEHGFPAMDSPLSRCKLYELMGYSEETGEYARNSARLTTDQKNALRVIGQAHPEPVVWFNAWTAAGSLIRRGLAEKRPTSAPISDIAAAEYGRPGDVYANRAAYTLTPAGVETWESMR